MQGDRDVSGTGRNLPFFGRSASFPVGPFRLAAFSGAPLLPVFVLQENDGRYRTLAEEPIRLALAPGSRSQPDEGALEAALAHWVGVLSRVIRENPTQWYLFTRFWEARDPAEGASL
jgi:KDO2-lipid IV(A) lauroyltransferase